MTEREGAPLSFCRILAPPPPQCTQPPPPPRFKNTFTIYNDRDGGRYYFCMILEPNTPPPKSHNPPPFLTIPKYFSYLNERDEGSTLLFLEDFGARPYMPLPPPLKP